MTDSGAKRGRQARGEATQREVLAATLRVLAREGARGVTHRAVAAEAGTSLRATTYYFASREVLLREALRYYAETAGSRIALLAKPIEASEDMTRAAAGLLADIVLSDLLEDREGLISEYELVLHVGRQPDFQVQVAPVELHQRPVQLVDLQFLFPGTETVLVCFQRNGHIFASSLVDRIMHRSASAVRAAWRMEPIPVRTGIP